MRGAPNHANPATHLRTVDEPRGIATLLEDPAEAHLGLRLLGRGILLLVCEGEQGGGKEEGKKGFTMIILWSCIVLVLG